MQNSKTIESPPVPAIVSVVDRNYKCKHAQCAQCRNSAVPQHSGKQCSHPLPGVVTPWVNYSYF